MSGKKGKNLAQEKSIFITFATIGLLVLALFELSFYLSPVKPEIKIYHNKVNEEISFWENFLAIYPDYKAGWIRLAKLEIKNANPLKARNALKMAENIDPNDSELKKIKENLNYF